MAIFQVCKGGFLSANRRFSRQLIFRTGLDIAQVINGYVYHTKYDNMDVIPRGSIQNTGDNILSLVRALSNAPELSNTAAYKEGHVVFFDVLGLFMVSYTEDTGKLINFSASGVAIILIIISIWRMSAVSGIHHCQVVQRIVILVILQIVGLGLGFALPIVVAYYFDSIGLSIAYFSSLKLLIGLYVCPSLLGLSLPVMIYFHFNKNVSLYAIWYKCHLKNPVFFRTSYPSITTCNWPCIAGLLFWHYSISDSPSMAYAPFISLPFPWLSMPFRWPSICSWRSTTMSTAGRDW